MKKHLIVLLGAAALLSPQPGAAAPIELTLNGTTSYDGWKNLSIVGGYTGASFPGTGAWPTTGNWTSYNPGTGAVGAIGSNTEGSGDALLYRIATGTGGGPYPAGSSIYFGGFSAAPNVNDGTLGVVDTTPLTGLRTVAFQVEIGEAFGYDFYNHVLPVLQYTTASGTFTLEASYSDRISQLYNGDILMPTGYEDIYINTWGVQFDLSQVEEPITSYTLSFTGVQHAQLYSLQLDQSTAAYDTSVFPQSVLWLGGGADDRWGTAGNWEGDAVPADGGKVTFSGSGGVVLESGKSVEKLTLDAGGGFTIGSAGGAVLTIGAGGLETASAAPASYAVAADVVLTAFNILTIEEGDELTFAGDITAPGFYKKGGGTLRLAGDNVFTGNAYNRVIILGGENDIVGTNTYTGQGTLELNVKDAVVTLHGGDNRLGGNFTLNLVSTATYDSTGTILESASTGRVVLGDALGKSDQTFAGIQSDRTSAFNEGASASYTLAASSATISGGSAAISTLTSNVASGSTFEYWGNIGGTGANQNAIAFVKQGAGVQALGGASAYAGDTVIRGGMLRIDNATALSANSNVQLDGGVLGLGAANYSATLGAGAGQIQFLGDGGFAAYAAARTVTLNGGATLAWGSTSGFLGDGSKLILSHTGANNTVELANAIGLGSQARTVQVDNGSASVDGRLGGALGGTGGLNKTGAGTLELTAANSYTGGTAVKDGALNLAGASGAIKGDVTVGAGASFQLTNTATANNGSRLENTAKVTMQGGVFNFNHSAGAASYAETLGELALEKGANTVTTSQAASGQTSVLTIGSLTRGAGATVNFSATTLGTRNNIAITSAPLLDDGIIGAWATTGSTYEFATYSGGSVAAYTGYSTNLAQASWASTNNVKLNTAAGMTTTLAAARVINSLVMNGATSGTTGNQLNLGGSQLRLGSGGFIATGGASTRTNVISNGTLTAGNSENTAAELIATVAGTATTIGANVVNNGTGAVSLVKAGSGTLTLGGSNTYTGDTTVSQGVLALTGSLAGGGGVAVRKGATLTVNGALTAGNTVVDGTLGGGGAVAFAPGSTLSGSGSVNIALTVGSGTGQLSRISPGNSPGTLAASAQTWAPGGGYVWEISDVDAGAGTGWDLLSVTGALAITATAESPFTIHLASLALDNAAGVAHDFDGAQSYSWTIATAGSIDGFQASKFAINGSAFTNDYAGAFGVAQSGNSIVLVYTAVPEPSTWGVVLGAGLFALALLRRRARSGNR